MSALTSAPKPRAETSKPLVTSFPCRTSVAQAGSRFIGPKPSMATRPTDPVRRSTIRLEKTNRNPSTISAIAFDCRSGGKNFFIRMSSNATITAMKETPFKTKHQAGPKAA